jgi:hypothetical protein
MLRRDPCSDWVGVRRLRFKRHPVGQIRSSFDAEGGANFGHNHRQRKMPALRRFLDLNRRGDAW